MVRLQERFLAACRPFIGVDGCHLKTKYGEQLLLAVGRDPNDQYFPLEFTVVDIETEESWRWFLKLILEDIGDATRNQLVFISDHQKASPIQLAGRLVYREEWRPSGGIAARGGRRGRGRTSYQTNASRGRFGARTLGRRSDPDTADYNRLRGDHYP